MCLLGMRMCLRLPCGPGARGPNQSDCRSRSRPSAGLGKQLLPARAAACAVLSRDVCVSDQVWANGTSSSSQASSCRLLGRIRIIGTFLITRACGVTTATPRLVPRSSHSRRTSRNTHARARLSATPALLRWSARFRSVMLRRAPHVVPFVVHVGRGGCRASST